MLFLVIKKGSDRALGIGQEARFELGVAQDGGNEAIHLVGG